MNNIVILSEKFLPPYDEGFKNIVLNLVNFMIKKRNVFFITDNYFCKISRSFYCDFNRSFLSINLFKLLRAISPNLILYIPYSSVTPASLLRTQILKLLCIKTKVILMALQFRYHSKLSQKFFNLLKFDGIVFSSYKMKNDFSYFKKPYTIFYAGVDIYKFKPVSHIQKKLLKKKYGFSSKDFIILHVGHLKKSRNIDLILKLSHKNTYSFCLILSSTTRNERDCNLISKFNNKQNIKIIDTSLNSIEEIYQLSDCYLFPVQTRIGATEVPLSVLEAMAVNLPVITTPYGALPEMFSHDPERGFYFAQYEEDFSRYLEEISHRSDFSTRQMVKDFSWEKRVEDLYQKLINWPEVYGQR